MHNPALAQSVLLLSFAPWVKNVHSSWIARVYSYTTLYDLYTDHTRSTLCIQKTLVKVHSFTHVLDSFTPGLCTYFKTTFNLLMNHLCTLSTVPTNTKNKEK